MELSFLIKQSPEKGEGIFFVELKEGIFLEIFPGMYIEV
jgi:hypothetical protein